MGGASSTSHWRRWRAQRIVVVGPDRDLPAQVITAREDPPFAGPVAAVDAGLAALGNPPDGREIWSCRRSVVRLRRADRRARSTPTRGGRPGGTGRRRGRAHPVICSAWRADAPRAALSTADASMGHWSPPVYSQSCWLTPTTSIPPRTRVGTPAHHTAAARRRCTGTAALRWHHAPSTSTTRWAPSCRPTGGRHPFPAFDTAAMDGLRGRRGAVADRRRTGARAGHAGDPLNVTGDRGADRDRRPATARRRPRHPRRGDH